MFAARDKIHVSLAYYVGVFLFAKRSIYRLLYTQTIVGYIGLYIEDLIHANINQKTKSKKYYCYRLRKSFDEHD